MAEEIYADAWGSISADDAASRVEIKWTTASEAMTAEDFKTWLERFVVEVESRRAKYLIVDASEFRMNPAHMDTNWRDTEIIPRYCAAGVQKFAFVMPPQMPAVGKPPAIETPGNYPTGYFATHADAAGWLAAVD